MKKIIRLIFIIMLFSLLINYVYADCTNEEISSLKKEAEKIRVTYKHLGAVEAEGKTMEYNHFNLTFNNLSDDMYLKDDYGNIIENNFDFNYISFETQTGKYKYYIYSKNCGSILKIINVNLPRFNIYSLDPLCDGINSEDFALCGKYLEYDVSYDFFEKKVNDYRNALINEKGTDEIDEKRNISYYFNYLFSYILKYYIYFILAFIFVLIFIIFIFFVRRKKNRGVLK